MFQFSPVASLRPEEEPERGVACVCRLPQRQANKCAVWQVGKGVPVLVKEKGVCKCLPCLFQRIGRTSPHAAGREEGRREGTGGKGEGRGKEAWDRKLSLLPKLAIFISGRLPAVTTTHVSPSGKEPYMLMPQLGRM